MTPSRTLRLLIAAFALLLSPYVAFADVGDAATSAAIRSLISSGRHPWLARAAFAAERGNLVALYAADSGAPLWTGSARRREAFDALIAVLRAAAEKGLDPRDYEPEALATRRASADAASPAAGDAAALDVGASIALLRFLSDVHRGRVDPRAVHFGIDISRKQVDLVRLVREAAVTGDVETAVDTVEPSFPMYRRLLQALATYRALTARPFDPLPAAARGKLAAGDAYPALGTLAARLVAFGDLPADVVTPERYEGAIQDGVKRFQSRHGLEADGVIGRATLAALNVTPEARVRQMELALERLRWLPDLASRRAIVVNIPEFTLRAFDLEHASAEPALRMKVVVGREAPTHRTPVFAERMTVLEFSPYWNVPPGILARETLPQLRKTPASLEREHMEIVYAGGATSTRVDASALDALASGKARVRQRPGPWNAVGGVKFVFPNAANVYLHDTPARALFERTRRDFSHGCIRVADPVALARFVLASQSEWTEATIREAMTAGETRFVKLVEPVPVLIYYVTTIVETDGRVLFLPDVYGHDRTLADTLAASRRR